MVRPEEIQKIIDSMEHEIAINTEFMTAVVALKKVAQDFDGRMFNKRFTDALQDVVKPLKVFNYKKYSDAVEIVIYRPTSSYNELNTKHFRFSFADCFTGDKLRVSAVGFSDRCTEIRNNLVESNSNIRRDIDSVYQMLQDAEDLKKRAEEYDNKYSYNLKSRFGCCYRLQNW